MGLVKNIIEFPFGIFKLISPDKRDPKSRKYYYTYNKSDISVVKSDRSQFCTTPAFNQGRMGSCVRCAIAGGMEMVYRQNGAEIDFAEQQYRWDEDTDPNKGQGMMPEHGLRETLRIGQSEAKYWEKYRDDFEDMARPTDTQAAIASANRHRIKSFHRITKIDQIYEANCRKDGFVCGSFWLDDQWHNSDVQIIKYKKYPKLELHEMFFWLTNPQNGLMGLVTSWGRFGIGWTGRVWVEPEWIEKRMQDVHFVRVLG